MPRPAPRPNIAWRLVLAIVGTVLLLVGLAGLALPGIQGILTLLVALACLSFASEKAHLVLRWCFRRWPRGWRRFLRSRRWLARYLGIRPHRRPNSDMAPPSQSENLSEEKPQRSGDLYP